MSIEYFTRILKLFFTDKSVLTHSVLRTHNPDASRVPHTQLHYPAPINARDPPPFFCYHSNAVPYSTRSVPCRRKFQFVFPSSCLIQRFLSVLDTSRTQWIGLLKRSLQQLIVSNHLALSLSLASARSFYDVTGIEGGQAVRCYIQKFVELYPLSYRVPVRERYGSTLLPATREQHDQNRTQSH